MHKLKCTNSKLKCTTCATKILNKNERKGRKVWRSKPTILTTKKCNSSNGKS